MSGLLLAVGTSSVSAALLPPAGLNPGDTYRLVFLTDGTTQAGSDFISTYNAFVQSQAALAPALNALGTTWKAIGSTFGPSETSSAYNSTGNNTGPGAAVPIFRLDGVKVANNNADLWDGTLQNAINVTPTGVSTATRVWSGTNPGGDYYYWFPLSGKPFGPFDYALFGNPQLTTGWLGNNTHEQVVAQFPMYAISDLLTVAPVPEPSTYIAGALLLLPFGASTIRRFRNRKQAV